MAVRIFVAAAILISAMIVVLVIVLMFRAPAIRVVDSADQNGRLTRQMIVDDILHGTNFVKPGHVQAWGHPQEDHSRLATTYYHRLGPVGGVMEKFCWFQDQENHFNSDSRICASLVAGANPLFGTPLPTESIPALWSEPPVASIGLGCGTMASYARPYQHMHFYEADARLPELSLRKEWPLDVNYLFFRDPNELTRPDAGDSKAAPQFTYLRDALARGAHMQVLMGEPLQRLAAPYKSYYEFPADAGGPRKFYHVIVVDGLSTERAAKRLVNKQTMEMYFQHLTEDGILCAHVSSRTPNMALIVTDIADQLGFAAKVGHDPAPYRKAGHMSSEWVMVARKAQDLRYLREPPGFRDAIRASRLPIAPMWTVNVR
jgi:hypothetical protein